MAESAEEPEVIEIEVAYAKPEAQAVVRLSVPHGTTLWEAISLSGLLAKFPEINQADLKTGVFGVVCKPEHILQSGDRVEIYRLLLHDPKEARRQRALKQK
jgi:uncharacterized protein